MVDHGTGRLVWAGEGRSSETLNRFFDELGAQRCDQITHTSADQADWIALAVKNKCPNAVMCADPFHIVAWATDALDEVRLQAWRDARALLRNQPKRRRGRPAFDDPDPAKLTLAKTRASTYRGCRYALWKNPENLTDTQQQKLEWIAKTDPRLHRAYLLKEGIRTIYQLPPQQAAEAFDKWISWAQRSQIPAFTKLAKRLKPRRPAILAAITNNLSNGLIESMNTKIRLLTRIAFGFRSAQAVIAIAMLTHAGKPPQLPARKPTHTSVR